MRNLLAALAVCFAVPAWGQSLVQAGSDTIELREPTEDCHCIGLLVYSNGISNFAKRFPG